MSARIAYKIFALLGGGGGGVSYNKALESRQIFAQCFYQMLLVHKYFILDCSYEYHFLPFPGIFKYAPPLEQGLLIGGGDN